MPENLQNPQPILNKPMSSAGLNNSDSNIRGVSPAKSGSTHYHNTSPSAIGPLDSNSAVSPSHLLYTNPSALSSNAKISSVSFTVPDQVEKSHRGSISARPSSLQVSTLLNQQPSTQGPPSQISTQNPLQHPSSLRAPSSGTIKTALESSSPVPTSSAYSNQVSNSRQQHSSSVHPSTALQPRSTSSGSVISTSSSRQNSSTNLDYIQFTPQSFHNHPRTSSEFTEKVNSPPQRERTSPVDLSSPSTPTFPGKKIKEKQIKAVIEKPTQQIPYHQFFQKHDDQKLHILIGATGSVATIKVPLIIDKLYKIFGSSKLSIQLVVTKAAEHFLKGLKINTEVKIWRDDEEWFGYKKMGDSILHQELRKWADIMLVSPLSANTLAKISNGICDNLLTAIIRSWNPQTPMLVAPAMNTFMYTHPLTKKHMIQLKEDCPWIEILKPVEKILICGDIGMGGMREWSDIVEILLKKIRSIKPSEPEKKYNQDSIEENENEEDDEDDEEEDDDDEDEEDDEEDDDEEDDDDEDDDEDDDDDDEDDEERTEEKGVNESNGHKNTNKDDGIDSIKKTIKLTHDHDSKDTHTLQNHVKSMII